MKSNIELLEDSYKKELESIIGNINLSIEEIYLISTISSKFLNDLKSLIPTNIPKQQQRYTGFNVVIGNIKINFPNKESYELHSYSIPSPKPKLKPTFFKSLFSKVFSFSIKNK